MRTLNQRTALATRLKVGFTRGGAGLIQETVWGATMRSEYRDFFARRMLNVLSEWGARPPLFRFPGRLEYSYEVGEVVELIPTSWRVDAIYFLTLSIHQMVVEPYMYVEQPRYARLNQTKLWPDLVADIDDIIRRTEEVSKKRDRGYVSATSVAVALGELAPNLKTTGFQIWGPGDESDER